MNCRKHITLYALECFIGQQYPPGTQENYNSFLSRDLMMGKGKELELPEGPGGGKGSGIREADSDDRGFPLQHGRKCPRKNKCTSAVFMI
jgi:hypothetical protein